MRSSVMLNRIISRNAAQRASGRPCDRPIRSRFSVFFLGRRANNDSVLKPHFALYAYSLAIPIFTSKFPPKCNPLDVVKISSKCRLSNTKLKVIPDYQLPSLSADYNSPSSITLPLLLPSALSYLQCTFTRRTSGRSGKNSEQ